MPSPRTVRSLYDSEATLRLVTRELDELNAGGGVADPVGDAAVANILDAVESAYHLLEELDSNTGVDTARATQIRGVLRDELLRIIDTLQDQQLPAQLKAPPA